MVLELNDKEQEILKRALNSFEGELRTEIGKTDKRDFKAALLDDEVVIKKIIEKVTWH